MNKEYKVTEEMGEIIQESYTLEELADKYIKLPFSFKKVKSLFTESRKTRRKFWKQVYKLYPELEGLSINYNFASKKVKILEKQDE